MNTYNENLRSTIVSSLQSQNTDQKDLKSNLNSTMFSLYHSQGASITAEEKLTQTKIDQDTKAVVKKQAVANSNASNNELKSATQADAFVKSSVSNAAVCAANVQIAANAVTKLASDVGSIYSIINAADFDTDIYIQAKEANELMNDTAYGAELNSQVAMEASTLASEVSSAVVLNESKSINTAVKNLLKITSDEYDTASQAVVNDNAAVSDANATEKNIEGNMKYLTVDYNAASNAYNSMNKELNQQLKVITGKSNTSFVVKFNKILNPFYETDPVNNYYLFVVKESKANTFSISNAEGIITKHNQRFIAIEVPEKETPAPEPEEVAVEGTNVSMENGVITTHVNFLNIKDGKALLDVEGNEIVLGENYVTFLMAVYTDEYKRSINNFSDFLSAPSLAFSITTHLNAVKSKDIIVNKIENKTEADFTAFLSNYKSNVQAENSLGKKADYNYKITFSVDQNPEYKVEYRCILLPAYKDTSEQMLTMGSMKSLIQNISSIDTITKELNPKIKATLANITETELQLEQAKSEGNEDDVKKLNDQLGTLNTELKNLNEEKEEAIKSINPNSVNNINFIFNLPIAEQIPMGSYVLAKEDTETKGGKKGGKTKDNEIAANKETTHWLSYISADTTDNFGNLLIDGNIYIPVILTFATEENANENSFTNALSDFNTIEISTPDPDSSKAFTYKDA